MLNSVANQTVEVMPIRILMKGKIIVFIKESKKYEFRIESPGKLFAGEAIVGFLK